MVVHLDCQGTRSGNVGIKLWLRLFGPSTCQNDGRDVFYTKGCGRCGHHKPKFHVPGMISTGQMPQRAMGMSRT